MTKRGQGEGSIHWHEGRRRWTGIATLGYDPAGKRIRKYVYGRTKDGSAGQVARAAP